MRRCGGRGQSSVSLKSCRCVDSSVTSGRSASNRSQASRTSADLAGVAGDGGDADLRPAVQVLVADLGGGDGEAAPQLGHDRPDDGALALERVDVAQQQVGGERAR